MNDRNDFVRVRDLLHRQGILRPIRQEDVVRHVLHAAQCAVFDGYVLRGAVS